MYALPFFLAAAFAFVLTPFLRLPALKATGSNAADYLRRLNDRPRVGGMAIFLAFSLALVFAAQLSHEVSRIVSPRSDEVLGLLVAGPIVLVLGLFDDLRIVDYRQKFFWQSLAAVVIYVLGYRLQQISVPGDGVLNLGYLDLPLTVVWIVGLTNAVNFLDGRDGVAGGISVIALLSMAAVSYDAHHTLTTLLLITLAGATLGFMPYNFPPASRYLGDSGALTLGFILAALSVRGATDDNGRLSLYIPVIALGLPILDTGIAAVRRMLERRLPFSRDEDHIHHRMERRWRLRPRPLALTMYGIAAVFGLCAVALRYVAFTVSIPLVAVTLTLLIAWLVVSLGYWSVIRDGLRGLRRPAPAGAALHGGGVAGNGAHPDAPPPAAGPDRRAAGAPAEGPSATPSKE
ncbi:MAG TPA: MraY family glycosyltransferase [Dehalococcoidia bacterium]